MVNSTTVNIHQLISTFYNPTKEKYKILIDDLNFPTDRYAIESHVQLRGYTVEEAGIETIREKSLHMSAYLMYMIDNRLKKYGFGIGNPMDDKQRI